MSSAPLDRKCQDGKIFLICIPCPAQCFRHDRQAMDIVFIEVDTSCIIVRIIGQLLFFLTMRENKQEGKEEEEEEEEEKEEEKDKDEEEEKEK